MATGEPKLSKTILYWQDDESGETESVQFDVVEGEEPEDTATPTDHAVEEGANITDHVRDEPAALSIEGFVSNIVNPALDDDLLTERIEMQVPTIPAPGNVTKPLDVPSPPIQPSPSGVLQAGVGALKTLLSGGPKFTYRDAIKTTTRTVSFSALQQEEPRDRIRDVYELLKKAKSRKFLITVQEAHTEHFDMVITRIGKPRSIEDGKGARFQVDLRQIRVADSETVQAPQPTEARGKTGVNAGSKNGKADPNAGAKEAQYESTLSQIGGAVGF